jgi:enamine deaminase RidA (YjgF/YER057c/UK114 family)
MSTTTVAGKTNRTPINPWSWSAKLGFDQAHLIEGHRRQLVCSGQDSVDADGNPQHPADMAAQLELALGNLEAVLAGADMTLANVVPLNVYTTDVDELFKHWGKLPERFATVDGHFVTSVSACRGWQPHRCSCCWRQPRLTDPAADAWSGGGRRGRSIATEPPCEPPCSTSDAPRCAAMQSGRDFSKWS